jgi:hypothetical protein
MSRCIISSLPSSYFLHSTFSRTAAVRGTRISSWHPHFIIQLDSRIHTSQGKTPAGFLANTTALYHTT